MNARLPLAITTAACVILFGAIALVFTLVVTSLIIGGPIDFPGEPEIADAASLSSLVLAA